MLLSSEKGKFTPGEIQNKTYKIELFPSSDQCNSVAPFLSFWRPFPLSNLAPFLLSSRLLLPLASDWAVSCFWDEGRSHVRRPSWIKKIMSEDLVPISEDELLLLLLRVWWVGTYVVGTAARFHLFFSLLFCLVCGPVHDSFWPTNEVGPLRLLAHGCNPSSLSSFRSRTWLSFLREKKKEKLTRSRRMSWHHCDPIYEHLIRTRIPDDFLWDDA